MLTKTKDEILISANGDYRYDSLTVMLYSGDFGSYFSYQIIENFQPVLASDDLLQLLPPVVTYVAEHDVLKDDGVLLHKRLRMFGGKSEIIQWDGGIHAQVALSAQFAPLPDGYDPVPEATIQVQEYFHKMKSVLYHEPEPKVKKTIL